MQLLAKRFDLQAFTNSKAFRFTNYSLMALVSVIIYSALNGALAISEDSLEGDLSPTDGDLGDAQVATGILGGPVNWLINFLNGTGGLLATIIALIFAVFAAISQKSLAGLIICFGIGLAAIYGPRVLLAFFGAVI